MGLTICVSINNSDLKQGRRNKNQMRLLWTLLIAGWRAPATGPGPPP